MDDYPNDGEALGIYQPEEPKEQVDTKRAERTAMAQSLPVIEDILKDLDTRITHYKTVDAVEINDDMDDTKIARQLMVNKLVAKELLDQRNNLEAKFNAYNAEVQEQRNA